MEMHGFNTDDFVMYVAHTNSGIKIDWSDIVYGLSVIIGDTNNILCFVSSLCRYHLIFN
jgi:hypothetical protein